MACGQPIRRFFLCPGMDVASTLSNNMSERESTDSALIDRAQAQSHLHGQRERGAIVQTMALGELFPAADPRPFAAVEGVPKK